jgi:hypothetical protein
MIERDPQKRISLAEVKTNLRFNIDFQKITNNYARQNNSSFALSADIMLSSGTFKNVYKGKYLIGERAGEECVWKSFKSGSVFEESFFEAELRVVEKALKIINSFNKNKVINQTIWLNKPGIWTSKSSSTVRKVNEKVMVEPLISNFEKFNSNTGWIPDKSSPWIEKMQALSHYSYHSTDRHLLLCDLQGEAMGSIAVITDPIIISSTKEYGPTDLGDQGISTFFANHTCNKYCDSKWMIPHDRTSYFEKRKGSSMVLSTELSEFHLVDQSQENEMTF